MACLQPPPWLSSTITNLSSPKPTIFPNTHSLKPFKILSSFQNDQNPIENKQIPDKVRIALEKAREYKKNKGLVGANGGDKKIGDSGAIAGDKKSSGRLPAEVVSISDLFSDGDFPEVEIIVGDPSKFGNQTRSKPAEIIQEDNVVSYKPKVTTWGVDPKPNEIPNTFGGEMAPVSDPFPDDDFPEVEIIVGDPSKFGNQTRSKPAEIIQEDNVGSYKPKITTWGVDPKPNDIPNTIPDKAGIAMEKAREYRMNKGLVGASGGDKKIGESESITGGLKGGKLGNGFVEKKIDKKDEPVISSIDFTGLNFADKKSSGRLPTEVVSISDLFSDGNFPEVEIIVGDPSKFGNQSRSKPAEIIQEDNVGSYKPKVTTWGVDPKPNDIPNTFGGEMATVSDPFPDDDFPEVEIIVGDPSKFGDQTRSKPAEIIQEDNVGSYKPKITTWGVDPKPNDIPNAIPDKARIAMEKAREYKKNKGLVGANGGDNKIGDSGAITGGLKGGKLGNGFEEKKIDKKDEPVISSIDFTGLNFADKKSSGRLPTEVVSISDLFSDGNFPEVEIIVGDPSKFGNQSRSKPAEIIQEDNVDSYKPKVTTWGVDPKPNDIPNTFGGEMAPVSDSLPDDDFPEVEIIVGDPSKFGNQTRSKPAEIIQEDNVGSYKPKVTTQQLDPRPNDILNTFGGEMAPVSDPLPDDDFPEVEFIVGDASKFGNQVTSKPAEEIQKDNVDLYKPKVSTWGVFPRPKDISKTYGGGRTIRPGDVLETAEVRAAKEARTRRLITEYKKSIGFYVDPKLKSECQKVLEDGDSLMDSGKLKEAIPCYQQVMDKMVFQSELHGLAALKWSICQDSLLRHNEARRMYERLRTHPNDAVKRKARHFASSFEAMTLLKVNSSNFPLVNPGYQKYFDAFVPEETINYSLLVGEVDEGAFNQALPYLIFLLSPIFTVLLLAIQKGNNVH